MTLLAALGLVALVLLVLLARGIRADVAGLGRELVEQQRETSRALRTLGAELRTDLATVRASVRDLRSRVHRLDGLGAPDPAPSEE